MVTAASGLVREVLTNRACQRLNAQTTERPNDQ